MSDERRPAESRNRRVCAVCGRTLDYVGATDVDDPEGWQHTFQDIENGSNDHPAIPVRPEEIEEIDRCDFCNQDYPSWVVPVRSFEVLPGHMSDGDWAACDICHQMIANNQWGKLIRRCAAIRTDIPQESLRLALSDLYSKLRTNITGDPYPIKKQ